MWESRWLPGTKKKKADSLPRKVYHRYRQGWATTYHRQPIQQGSAVYDNAGFTSDQRFEWKFRFLMTDKTSVRKVLTLHLENNVLSVACRHAIKQNILKLMEASFQRIKYLFCNVPWKPHIRNRRSKYLDQDIRGNCYNRKLCNGYTLWRKQSKKIGRRPTRVTLYTCGLERTRLLSHVGHAEKSVWSVSYTHLTLPTILRV